MKLPAPVQRVARSLRQLLPGARPRALVAVDVGSSSVRAIHVRLEDEDLVLDGVRWTATRDAAGHDLLEAGCRQAIDLRFGDEPVAVCVSSPEAAIRKVELPAMSLGELHEALPWEARRHIAGLAEDAILDAQVLSPGTAGSPMEIVLVAFPREPYRRVESVWESLGVTPSFIDVGQLATLNSLFTTRAGPAGVLGVLGVLDLGSDEGSFSVLSRSSLILFRDLSPRVSRLDSLLADRFGLEPSQLEIFKSDGKLPDGRTAAPGEVEDALSDLIGELAEDLRSGLVYLENRTGAAMERVHLTGAGGSLLGREGIADSLAALAGVVLERYDPFRDFHVSLTAKGMLEKKKGEFCAAAGVARRFFAD